MFLLTLISSLYKRLYLLFWNISGTLNHDGWKEESRSDRVLLTGLPGDEEEAPLQLQ